MGLNNTTRQSTYIKWIIWIAEVKTSSLNVKKLSLSLKPVELL